MMNYRKFGNTELKVSEIGFGGWGIGGSAVAGDLPIGWGETNDEISEAALLRAHELGVNFFDTADFYGFGHSEELIGKVFGNRKDILVATKVGHRLSGDDKIVLDYSGNYILSACENSLKRLRRDYIDYYQLHSARIEHLAGGETVDAMLRLKEQGKIRYWGISLNTFNPFPEARYLLENNSGDGFQLVLNIINQRALPLIEEISCRNYGVIARMPLQFGLLTGKFNADTEFQKSDHRRFRLTKKILSEAFNAIEPLKSIALKYNISMTSLSLSFILMTKGISTVIPGIKTPLQAEQNSSNIINLNEADYAEILKMYKEKFSDLVLMMEKQG